MFHAKERKNHENKAFFSLRAFRITIVIRILRALHEIKESNRVVVNNSLLLVLLLAHLHR